MGFWEATFFFTFRKKFNKNWENKAKKNNHKILKHFLKKNRCRRQVFFIFFFLKNRCGTQVYCFISSKTDEACIYMSRNTLRQCSMGGDRCTTCTAPDDIWTDTRAMLDIKSDDFLEKRPFTTSRRKMP